MNNIYNNKTSWIGLNSTDNFNMVEKEPYDMLDEYYGQKTHYRIDEWGFRNFITLEESEIVIFGCSHTMGHSNDIENTYPYILSNILDQPVYNAGVCGTSIQSIARLIFILKDKLIGKEIIIWVPQIGRIETITKYNHYDVVLPNEKRYPKYIPQEPPVDKYIQGNILNALMLIEACLRDNKVSYFSSPSTNIAAFVPIIGFPAGTIVDFAKDRSHFGPKSNILFAHYIKKHIR